MMFRADYHVFLLVTVIAAAIAMSKINWRTIWFDPSWRHQLTNAVIASAVLALIGTIGGAIYLFMKNSQMPLFGWIAGGAVIGGMIGLCLWMISKGEKPDAQESDSKQQEIKQAPVANPVQTVDYIPGTTVTHSQIQSSFPHGYIIFSERDGNWSYDAKPSEKYQWDIDPKDVKIVPNFENNTVHVHIGIRRVARGDGSPGVEIENSAVSFTALIKKHTSLLVSDRMVRYENEPAMWFSTLSDNQRFPVWAIGFRIGPFPQ